MRTFRVLLCAACIVAALPAVAQGLDGKWQGRIRCEAQGSLAPLNAPVTVTVAGGQARYEREVRSTSDSSRVLGTEFGTGAVAADGTVRITTSFGQGTSRQSAEYSGRLTRPSATLAGTNTVYSPRDRAGAERRCTVTLTPG